MSNKNIKIKIITPERSVFEDNIDQVTLTVESGEMTMFPDHIPYTGSLKPSEILVKKGNEITSLAVSGGFMEFSNNILTVLADTAERAEEIDLARAEEAKKRAEELKKQKVTMDDTQFAKVAALMEKEMARIKVARKHRTRKGIHVEHLNNK